MARKNGVQLEDPLITEGQIGALHDFDDDDEDLNDLDRGDNPEDDGEDDADLGGEDDSVEDEAAEEEAEPEDDGAEDDGAEDDGAEDDGNDEDGDDEGGEEGAEEEVEEGEQEPAPKKDTNPTVPRARLNKEIQRRKELENQIKALQAQQPAAQQPQTQAEKKQVEIDRKELAKALEKVLDGDVEDAAGALAAVLASVAPQEQAKQELDPEQIAKMVEQKFEMDALQEKADELVADMPFLNESDEDHFDEDAFNDVIALRDTYVERRGMKPAKALEKAAKLVAQDYGYVQKASAKEEAPAKPASKPKPANVAKKLELAKKSPKRIPQSSTPESERKRVSVTEMADDDFDNMSRDALARARGDIL